MSEFARGAYVRKKSGAFWEGVVVGHYSTDQTPDGVAVQLFGWEDGPVQIYPASALEPCDPSAGRLAPQYLTVNLSEDELAELQVAVRNSAPGKIAVATPPPSTHVWGDAKAEDCVLSIGSQRVCAHGTLGCVNHHAPQSPAAGWTPPLDCDGKEQLAFEAWASGERYDMNQHPLHYLFMDKRTNAARQGWKAALRYVREQHALAATEASDHG